MNAYVIITIIVFILIITSLIIWILSLNYTPNIDVPIIYSKAGLYMPCVNSRDSEYTSSNPDLYSPQLCDDNLVCIIDKGQTTGICRKSEGSKCTTVLECEPSMSMCYQGICTDSYTGGVNQEVNRDGSCNNDLIPINGYCKLPLGSSCTSDESCAEGQCLVADIVYPDEKICAIGRNNTESCSFSDQCASKFCDFSTSQGICQPTNINTGDYRSACKYYLSEQQNTACFDKLSCSYDFMNQNNIGICLDTNYSWPSNGTDIDCSSTLGACINPTICMNGKCIFPVDDPLSCSIANSSGYCISNFKCENNICIPNNDQPGISDKWGIVQWNRSLNNQMGSWTKLTNLEEPGYQPILSSIDTSTGLLIIYSRDVSLHTSTDWDYKYIKNNEVLPLRIFFNIPNDWNGFNPIWVPKAIKFIPTNTTTLIGLLINISGTSWILTSQLPVDNNVTFTLPSRAIVSSGYNVEAYDFSMILKQSANITPKITLNYYNTFLESSWGDVISNNNTYTFNPIGGRFITNSTYQLIDLNNYIDSSYIIDGKIEIQESSINIGIPNISYFNTSLTTSSRTNMEILYITNINDKYYAGYIFGNNDVLMPVNVKNNSIPSISIVESGSSKPTTLLLLTTVI